MADFNVSNFNTRPTVVGAQPTSNGFNSFQPQQAPQVQPMQTFQPQPQQVPQMMQSNAFIPSAPPVPVPSAPMVPSAENFAHDFGHVESDTSVAMAMEEAGRKVVNGFNVLPKTINDAREYAKYLSFSLLVPAALRSTDTVDHSVDVFLIIAAGQRFDLSPEMALRAFYVANGRVDMFVKAKAGICIKYGSWSYKIEQQPGYYGVTYTGYRKDRPNEPHSVTYSTADAQLRNLVAIDANGNIFGQGKWADKWPDMIRIRALGRFLDEVFPDVIGGYTSREEMEDLDALPVAAEHKEGQPAKESKSVKDALKKTRTTKKVIGTTDDIQPPSLVPPPQVLSQMNAKAEGPHIEEIKEPVLDADNPPF